MSNEVLFDLFLRKLPAQICTALTVTGVTDVQKAAEAVDKVLEYGNGTCSSIADTGSKPAELPASTDWTQQLGQQVLATQQQIMALTEAVSKRTSQPFKFTLPSDPFAQAPTGRNTLCYYHYRFGASARKCCEPCSIKPVGNINEDQK